MKYTDKSFTVAVGGDAYAEGWDRIFGKKPAPRFDERELTQCAGCKEPLWYHPAAGAPDFCHPCRIEMAVPYLEGGAK